MTEALKDYLEMKVDGEEMSIVNLRGGQAIEMIDLEIKRVMANIDDPNTSKAKRKIKFEIVFAPNEDKTITAYAFQCRSELAGPDPVQGAATISGNKAFEINREVQRPLGFSNVRKIGGDT